MKDPAKPLFEKATRFLPVDMKDRLKTVFSRTTQSAPPGAADDLPDYSAIFNANKAPGQKKARFNGPLMPQQLSGPQGKGEEIEDAVIVAEDREQTPVRPVREEAPRAEAPTFQAKAETERPRETTADKQESKFSSEMWKSEQRASKTDAPSKPANVDETDFAAIFKSSKPKTPPKATSSVDDTDYSAIFKSSKPKAEQPVRQESRPEPRAEAKPPAEDRVEAATPPEHWDREPESRFAGLSSGENVRLKVERRNEERRAEERRAEERRAEEPVRPEPESAQSKARQSEEHMAAGFSYEAKPLEQPKDIYRGAAQPPTPKAETSERTNIQHQQKETSSMYAKGQQQESHENGTATVRTEGTSNVASIAIERNSKFSGQLKFSGSIAIDGHVEGEIVAERVVVHEGGVVNATVEGNSVVVAGTVKGDIYARAELEILPSGVVHGSVTTPSINVRRGGRVEGRCAIGAPRQ